jgi:glycosyltransferase involved in cell wall biosynthesis
MQVSVVMPVYNGAGFLKKSLPALLAAKDRQTEIIVIDDASTDKSFEIASQFADQVFRLEKKTGSAEARNFGAQQARGEIVFFVDADVVVKKDSIRFLRNFFQNNREYSAIIGSYDDSPFEPDFFSQYRNLIHHYFHQIGHPESETFWSGCGAVKKHAFLEVKGYDGTRYLHPSIEDIEFGYRLREKGFRIRLEREFQAKHLKKWTFLNIIQTDIFHRAIPWSRLLLEKSGRKHTLNADHKQKISAVLVWSMILFSVIGLIISEIFLVTFLSLAGIVGLNWRLHKFFLRKKGLIFTICAFPMQVLYYLYSSLVFAYCAFDIYFLQQFKVNR